MPQNQNYWNEERTDTLKTMLADGNSWGLCAIALGCTRAAVAGKVHRMKGLPRSDRPHKELSRHPKNPKPKAERTHPMKNPEAVAPPIDLPVPSDAAQRSFSDMFGPLSFEMLDRTACRWPLGYPTDKDFVYCGANKHGEFKNGSWRELPYCFRHCKCAFNDF